MYRVPEMWHEARERMRIERRENKAIAIGVAIAVAVAIGVLEWIGA